MGNWGEERPAYEEELTPQQKEAAIEAEKERKEKECERGRKIILVMVILFLAMSVLATFFRLFTAESGGAGGYITIGLFDIILTAVIGYNLYDGKKWAKIVLALSIGWNILTLVGLISGLDISRTDYSDPTSNVTIVYSEGKAVKSWELGTAQLKKMQEEEDARVFVNRILMAVCLVMLAFRAGCLYLLFFYRPVQEFLYCQENGA